MHVGSVTLPTLKAHEEQDGRSNTLPASLLQASSEITDPISLSSQTGVNSSSLGSKESDEWEETGSVPPAPQEFHSRHYFRGPVPGSAEWILLDDD
jgi:hypothetical protein